MPLYLPRKVTSQPQGASTINWGNSISKGLIAAWTGSNPSVNIAQNKSLSLANASGLIKAGNKGIAFSSTAGTTPRIALLSATETPSGACCVTTLYKKRSGSNIDHCPFGTQNNDGALGSKFYVAIPGADGRVYFDFGGFSGTNRVDVGGLTFNKESVWSFNNSNSGLQIWQDGVLKATSGTSAATRNGNNPFNIGSIDGGVIVDNGDLTLIFVHNRPLLPGEIFSLSQNPWQLFRPSAVTVLGSSITYTYSRPTSDITTQWSTSSGSTHYTLIDETVADDADYIVATAAGQTDEVKLASMTPPQVGTNLAINYKVAGIDGGATVTVSLRQGSGGTLIKTDTAKSANGTYALTVAPGDWAAVTDWSDLRLRFVSA